jgi:small subunit ribosomal protein S18
MAIEVEREEGAEPVLTAASPEAGLSPPPAGGAPASPETDLSPPPAGAAPAVRELPADRGSPPSGEFRPATAPDDGERPRRGRGGRRRACAMCVDKMKFVDYKDVVFLRRYLSERGRIDTRRKSSCCAKHQRALAQAIKRARHLALLPYTADHIRGAGIGRTR